MRDILVGTTGHIDHGKTTLLKALTGIDTDRLAEEKRRGITIDLGFAHLSLASFRIGFVDVPGHEKLVKNMLAGIGGIDLALLVVAADESIMPQTLEHFHICRLLDIPRGIVVITKRDAVEPELLNLVRDEIRVMTRGSFLENGPVVAVDSISGKGLELLKQALIEQAGKSARNRGSRRERVFRLPVDRVFTKRGFGTVVTGTLTSGTIEKEDAVAVYPSGMRGRIRRIEIFNRETGEAAAGQRTALNLMGLGRDDLKRGMVLSRPGGLRPTRSLDASITVLKDAPRPLKRRTPVRLHHGSGAWLGHLYPLEGKAVAPGRRATVQIRLEQPAMCWIGDRFILRMDSPPVTVGGGVVLDDLPPRHRARNLPGQLSALEELRSGLEAGDGDPDRARIEFLVRSKGKLGIDVTELTARTGSAESRLLERLRQLPEIELIPQEPPLAVTRAALRNLEASMLSYLDEFHSRNRLAAGVPREELRNRFMEASGMDYFQFLLRRLEHRRRIRIDRSIVMRRGWEPRLNPVQERVRRSILGALRKRFPRPPTLAELKDRLHHSPTRTEEVYFFLIQQGDLLRVGGELVLTPSQADRLKNELGMKFSPGQSFSVPEFKDALGISRKYAIPFLEYLDREGVTRRQGDTRLVRRASATCPDAGPAMTPFD